MFILYPCKLLVVSMFIFNDKTPQYTKYILIHCFVPACHASLSTKLAGSTTEQNNRKSIAGTTQPLVSVLLNRFRRSNIAHVSHFTLPYRLYPSSSTARRSYRYKTRRWRQFSNRFNRLLCIIARTRETFASWLIPKLIDWLINIVIDGWIKMGQYCADDSFFIPKWNRNLQTGWVSSTPSKAFLCFLHHTSSFYSFENVRFRRIIDLYGRSIDLWLSWNRLFFELI